MTTCIKKRDIYFKSSLMIMTGFNQKVGLFINACCTPRFQFRLSLQFPSTCPIVSYRLNLPKNPVFGDVGDVGGFESPETEPDSLLSLLPIRPRMMLHLESRLRPV